MFSGLQSSVMKINVRHQLSFSTAISWQAARFQQILVLEGECGEQLTALRINPWDGCQSMLGPKERDMDVQRYGCELGLRAAPLDAPVLHAAAFVLSLMWDLFW